MPVLYKDILALHCGAQFLNVDLHIHSYGASKDVKDLTMTPQAIVDSAVTQNLSVIAITDHNSDRNIAAALSHAQRYADKLLVLPGVEVTTANGHLLVYFAPEKANELRVRAKITSHRDAVRTDRVIPVRQNLEGDDVDAPEVSVRHFFAGQIVAVVDAGSNA